MPFPNPRVLTSYLREYYKYRLPKWNSYMGAAHNKLYRDDKTLRFDDCKEINKLFYNQTKLSSLDGWIDLICTLGEIARKDFIGSDNKKMYCDTLQAIRSYIVACLL